MESLALNGIEILDKGQSAPAAEECGIDRESHYSVTT